MDYGQFDGSCDPNPGGRMGCGWHFTLDGVEHTESAEYAPAPGNSNNQAEWLALIHLLESYLAAGGTGPLEILGDSELVINQINGDWAVRNPALRERYDRAIELATQIGKGVSFHWVPRSFNAAADRLASGQTGAPPASVFASVQPHDVAPDLAAEIAALNAAGQGGFKTLMHLHVGGNDRFSRLRAPALETIVGPACVALARTAFPGDDPAARRAREVAYRWMARGLEAHLAIRKAQVDREIAANMQQRLPR
jgi:ribonuclease HI